MRQQTTKEKRRFHCHIQGCDKVYTRNAALSDHIRTHTGYRPFRCSSGCTKEFTSRDRLRSHEAIHSPIKRYVCDICASGFHRSCTLRRHERKVHRSVVSTDQLGPGPVSNSQLPNTQSFFTEQPFSATQQMVTLPSSNHLDTLSYDFLPRKWFPERQPLHLPDPSLKEAKDALISDNWRLLFEKGQYSDMFYQKSWFIAADLENASALEYLHNETDVPIEARKDSLGQNHTALEIVAMKGHFEALLKLITLGAKLDGPEFRGMTPLRRAIRFHKESCARELLKNGSDVDVTHTNGDTLLMTAVECSCSLELFAELLKRSKPSLMNAVNKQGRSIVHIAAGKKDSSYLSMAVEYGADITLKKTTNGWTAIHEASFWRRLQVLSYITERHGGLDINATATDGRTPLIILLDDLRYQTEDPCIMDSERGDESLRCIKILLDQGARVDATNDFDETPLDIAVECQIRYLAFTTREIVVEGLYNEFCRANALKPIASILELLVYKGAKLSRRHRKPCSCAYNNDGDYEEDSELSS